MGMTASTTAQLIFDGARVPVRLPARRRGRRDADRLVCLGLGPAGHRRVRDRAGAGGPRPGASDYAKERQQFGRAIAEFQGLQFMLADMAAAVDTARSQYLYAARLRDAGRDFSRQASVAKLVATDAAMKVTTDAVQVLGGYGYTRDFPAERYMREAKVTQIFEGTNQIQRMVIARSLLRSGRPDQLRRGGPARCRRSRAAASKMSTSWPALLRQVPAVLEDLVEQLGRLELGSLVGGHRRDDRQEDLGQPAMRDHRGVLALEVVGGGEGVQVVEQPPRLVLLDVETGQALQAALVVAGVDDLRLDAHGRAVPVGDDVELVDVEAEVVEPLDPLLDAPHLVGGEVLVAGQLRPQSLVAAVRRWSPCRGRRSSSLIMPPAWRSSISANRLLVAISRSCDR